MTSSQILATVLIVTKIPEEANSEELTVGGDTVH